MKSWRWTGEMCEWDWDRFANEKKVGDCHVNKVSIEASN